MQAKNDHTGVSLVLEARSLHVAFKKELSPYTFAEQRTLLINAQVFSANGSANACR